MLAGKKGCHTVRKVKLFNILTKVPYTMNWEAVSKYTGIDPLSRIEPWGSQKKPCQSGENIYIMINKWLTIVQNSVKSNAGLFFFFFSSGLVDYFTSAQPASSFSFIPANCRHITKKNRISFLHTRYVLPFSSVMLFLDEKQRDERRLLAEYQSPKIALQRGLTLSCFVMVIVKKIR